MYSVALRLLLWTSVTVLSTLLIWWGSSWLDTTSDKLSRYYGLPAMVRGGVIAAVGSSFPEFSTVVISTLIHDKFTLGVGGIIGSAIFNILVIPAVCGLRGDNLESSKILVYKEAQFYMVAGSTLLIIFALGAIYYPVDSHLILGTIDRKLALVPLALYGLYLFTHLQDTIDHDPKDFDLESSVFKQWITLAFSLLIITFAVEGLVRAAIGFGEIFHTPDFLWGLVVIAAATSLPDLFVSMRIADAGEGVTSLSNVLGSNTFDLLVAVPAGVMIAGEAIINFSAAVSMFAFLTLATVVFFAQLRSNLVLRKRECYVLLGFYGLFLIWIIGETIGILHLIPGK